MSLVRPLRICLVASTRFPIREPFAGGLEALTHALAAELGRRGHQVTLFAAPGSDPELHVDELPVPAFEPSLAARRDVNAPPVRWMAEHHAYLGLMLGLAQDPGRFDLVHNHSLHHLPVAMAPSLSTPLVTTLHTPPLPWLESAASLARESVVFTAVSTSTAAAWAHAVRSTPILNGVDVHRWLPGPGGGPAVWSGRLVREKAPHEAIDAARDAGMPLVLAGPTPDEAYFEAEIAPRLGPTAVHVGHLDHGALARLLGRASVALVTPAWDEPYGLVAAEAMACGTPVAAYARGALPEIVTADTGALARPGDPADLARAIGVARSCDRAVVRRHAEEHCSLTRMVDDYERLYASLVSVDAAA
ncbi:glycosyltransferase family 4 protein [Nocardioides sp. W7]|uniref:glycosyltransferase family 4 protein n=1 Tax=Nocardioides sp. W7 TaxID=2931390 RepID=UPI001FD51667|nr:glycosyltransferase family 4 protein [Nocardioides sp. W7]